MKNLHLTRLLTYAFAFYLLSGCLKDEDRVPDVETLAAGRITGTTVILNGYANTELRVPVTYEIGFSWGLDPNPAKMEHTISESFVNFRGDFQIF